MGNSAIRLSSLKKLVLLTHTDLPSLFPDIPFHLLGEQYKDYLIVLNYAEEKTIHAILSEMDNEEILQQIDKTKNAIHALKKATFRQTRNAFGAASGLFGAMSLFLINIVSWGIIANALLLTGPTLLLGGLIYWRGKREEKQINQDIEADFYEKTISLHLNYKKLIELKSENKQPYSKPSCSPIVFAEEKSDRFNPIKPYKEKRHPIANPLSHFIFPALSTIGMCYSVTKMGLLGSAIVAGGPVCWGIAISMGCCAGLYFCYKRYHFLRKKIAVEENFVQLAHQEKNLENEIEYYKNQMSPVHTYKQLFTKFMPNKMEIVQRAVTYATAPMKWFKSVFHDTSLVDSGLQGYHLTRSQTCERPKAAMPI